MTTDARSARVQRETRETRVEVTLDLDGQGRVDVRTGLGFLDHMWHAFAFHGGLDLHMTCEGDLHVDDHHTVEDTALALGAALDQALGDRVGVRRFGSAHAPLDDALARAVLDLSGRPWARVALGLRRERIGDVAAENLGHALRSLAMASRSTLHLDVLTGENDHHRVEAAYKATALALREAVSIRSDAHGVPSTKGAL